MGKRSSNLAKAAKTICTTVPLAAAVNAMRLTKFLHKARLLNTAREVRKILNALRRERRRSTWLRKRVVELENENVDFKIQIAMLAPARVV